MKPRVYCTCGHAPIVHTYISPAGNVGPCLVAGCECQVWQDGKP